MRKLAIVAFALSSTSVFAGDVGAPSPKVNIAPTNIAMAIAETGVSTNWATQPIGSNTKTRQIEEFNRHVEDINAKIQMDLEAKINEQIENQLQ